MAGKGDAGVSGESESIADKYFVCTECLVEGNVQSFVDLFYLTHALDGAEKDEEETLALARSEWPLHCRARLIGSHRPESGRAQRNLT
jgi:hypothetical protein